MSIKTVFDFARCARRPPTSWIASLALALVVTAGCGKSNPQTDAVAPPPSSDTTAAQQTPSPVPIPGAQPNLPANADDPQKMLQGLNRALLGWTIQNHRHPKTFEEFANSANFQIPAPPTGKKYTLSDRGYIILVSD